MLFFSTFNHSFIKSKEIHSYKNWINDGYIKSTTNATYENTLNQLSLYIGYKKLALKNISYNFYHFPTHFRWTRELQSGPWNCFQFLSKSNPKFLSFYPKSHSIIFTLQGVYKVFPNPRYYPKKLNFLPLMFPLLVYQDSKRKTTLHLYRFCDPHLTHALTCLADNKLFD